MAAKLKNLRRSSPSRALYFYGVTREPARVNASGIDGEGKVESLQVEGLTCWISRVDAAEYGRNLAQKMENLDWLADASVRHQRVVAAIAATTTVLPARFGVVFLSEASLRQDIARRKKNFVAAFRRVSGADEWGIKVFAGSRPGPAPVGTAAKSGKDYLRNKAAMLKARAPGSKAASPDVAAFARALNRVAADSTSGGKVSRGQSGLELQTSLLVRRADVGKFQSLLKDFAARFGSGHRIECSGPWPPYSFVNA